MSARREPIWPAGIVGSISHDGERAAAAVAWQCVFAGLGVDLASAVPLEADLIRRICRPAEIERLASVPEPGHAAKMIFAIKEATYKALWPSIRQILDFQDIEIVLDEKRARFAVISRNEICPAGLAARITGRYLQDTDLLAAGAALPA